MNKPHLVLVHGWLSNASCWNELLDYLRDYSVTVVSLPGHGNNAQGTFSDLDALIDILAEQTPDHSVWVGWSLGGLIAQLVAHKYPHKVSHLICISCGVSFVKNDIWNHGMAKEIFERFKKSFVSDRRRGANEFIALQSLGDSNAKMVRNKLSSCTVDCLENEEILAGLDILERIDMSGKMESYEHPVVFIAGEEDRLVDLKDVKAAVAQLCGNQNKSFFSMQGVAHSPLLSAPAELSNIIVRWLKQ